MTNVIVVNSLEEYKQHKFLNKGDVNEFWTISEKVLIELKKKHLKVYNLEKIAKQEEIDKLGILTFNIQEKISNLLNNKIKIIENIKFGNVYDQEIYRTLFILIYRSYLLKKLINKYKNKQVKIYVIGDPNILDFENFSFFFSRFDNVFSLIASKLNDSRIENITIKSDKKLVETKKYQAENISLTLIEKLFSILDNSVSSFFYKINSKINFSSLIGKTNIYVWRYNDNIADLFLTLIKRRYRVNILNTKRKFIFSKKQTNNKISFNYLKKDIENIFNTELLNLNIEKIFLSNIPIQIFLDRFLKLLINLELNKGEIQDYFKSKISNVDQNSTLLTGGFFSVEEKILYYFLKRKNLKIITFDHGITLGMSKYRDYFDRFYGTIYGDIGVYTNHFAIKTMDKYSPTQKKIIVGSKKLKTKKTFISNFLLRLIYKIKFNQDVIIIVAKLARNNLFISPYQANDYKFHITTKKLVKIVCNKFPNSKVILKLYPGARYIDEYEFDDLLNFKNLKIFKNTEFRWLKLIANKIITNSTESTLEQVLQNASNNYFLSFKSNPDYFSHMFEYENHLKLSRRLKILNEDKILSKRDFNVLLNEI